MQDWGNECICVFLKVNWHHKPQLFFSFFFTFSFRFALFVIQASFSTHAGSKSQHWFKEDLTYMYMSLNYQHATAVNNMLNERSG